MASASWISLCVFAFVLVAAVSGDEEIEAKEGFVISLDHSNFTDFIKKHEFVIVEFYAPWCGACQSLAPKYEKAASILSNYDPRIILAKYDAVDESNKPIATAYGVKVYPTLKIFKNGGQLTLNFKGPHEPDELVQYLKKHRGPASTEIKSPEHASDLVHNNKIVVVGVFPEFSGQEFENFVSLAENLRIDYEFAHTSDAKHLPRGESSVTGPLVRLFKPFDELFAEFKDFNADALEKFVDESSTPSVTIFDNDPNSRLFVSKFVSSPGDKAMLFTNFSREGADTFKSKYQEIARELKGEGLSFLLGDVDAGEGVLQAYGLNKDQVPFIIIQAEDGQKYLKANLEPDHLAPWVKAYKAGKVQPYLKSEPIPEVNDEPVKVVVGDTLQNMVLKSEKNVLVVFHTPWEQGYKAFAPILDKIGTAYQSVADVLVSKFQIPANDYPNHIFDVQDMPTLFFKRASGQLVRYEGELSEDAIVGFIEKTRDKVGEQEAVKNEVADQGPTKDEL